MEMLMQLKGSNGKISIFNDRIIISRNTLGGFIAFGVVGDKTYYYNSIQGVEISGGILRIIPKGCDNSYSYNSISYSDVSKAQKDSNVILLTPGKTKMAEKICEIITAKVNEVYLNPKDKKEQFDSHSNADEILKFKQLLDEGIITQEEFERKKQELLK